MSTITPEQALEILNIATIPANSCRLSRQDYANAEAALQCLVEFIKAHTETEKKSP